MGCRSYFFLYLLVGSWLPGYTQPAPSLFATGHWFRMAVVEQGIYRIDATFLRRAGVDPATFDPATVQLYGQPGGMLPQPVSKAYPRSLQPHATFLQHNGNNSWEEGEYALFYADSPDEYTYSATDGRYVYKKNLYTDTLYYFLTFDEKQGSRIPQLPRQTEASVATLQDYDAYYAHELEERNLLRSGRKWYGEAFTSVKKTRHFDVPLSPRAGVPILLESVAAGSCPTGCSLQVRLQDHLVHTHTFSALSTGTYARVAWHDLSYVTSTATSSAVTVHYDFIASGASQAYLDYFFLQLQQPLHDTPAGAFFFRHKRALAGELLTYEVFTTRTPFALWEVGQADNPKQLPFQLLESKLRFTYQSTLDHVPEFVLFSLSDAVHPLHIRAIPNQQPLSTMDVLIVSAPLFVEEAERLATFHRQHDKLRVQVLTTEQLYNETSAGRPDPTAIRNYAYQHYGPRGALKYLLLFGAASFDYREILHTNPPHVPTYASRESLDPLKTYVSDDYFGFLEENEGQWKENPPQDHTMDIGIGRLPARTAEEAATMVDKIVHYATSPLTLGNWRQKIYFVADDGDFNLHHSDVEKIAKQLDATHLPFQVKKLYLDDFSQEYVGTQQLAKEATKALDRAVQQGALVINFSGHGNVSVWTAEELLSREQVRGWNNLHKLPLFVTATCDFGRYDDPLRTSTGEELLMHPTGGGIALFTTARPVRSDANFKVNDALMQAVFALEPDGLYPRLGDIHKRTKNNSLFGTGNRSFVLLGDPALRLSYPHPQHRVQVTHINEVLFEQFTDTLRARSEVTLSGEVQNTAGAWLNDYTGIVQLQVYDKENDVRTLGDENVPYAYMRRNSLVFRGQARVENGRFAASFVVPQTISYRKGKGRMYFYLYPKKGAHIAQDGAGGVSQLYIGGPAVSTKTDATGPHITAFLDKKTLVNGLKTSLKPRLHLTLFDAQGIKLTQAGLTKNFSLTLDDNDPVLLAPFYQADLDTYQSGELYYDFDKLTAGKHTLTIQVWDNYDNFTEYKRYFFSSIHTPIDLSHVTNYPNPTRGRTFFSFVHNKGEHVLEVKIEMLGMKGSIIFSNSWLILSGSGEVVTLGVDLRRHQLCAGVYAYQLCVIDREDGARGCVVGKLIVDH